MKIIKTNKAFYSIVAILLSLSVPCLAIGFLALPSAIFYRLQGNTTMFVMTIAVAAILAVVMPMVNLLAFVGYDALKNR